MKHKLKLEGYDSIPIVIGITGHRDIFCGTKNNSEDREEIKAQVKTAIEKIVSLCNKNTPVIMLNALAQGADMLCAEVAFDYGIPVYAVLPCEKEKYLLSFNDCGCGRNPEEDRKHFYELLDKCAKVIIAPDQERLSNSVKEAKFDCTESYEYRQLGIYIAKYSHFLLALWDGVESTNQYGCGAAEVVKFALTHDYLDSEHVPVPGTINDSAVVWIKCRRKKSGCNSAKNDGCSDEIKKVYRIKDIDNFNINSSDKFPYKDSDSCPVCIEEIIKKTVSYNAEAVFIKGEIEDWLWGELGKSNEIKDRDLNSLRSQYFKADSLSTKYRDRYKHRMLAVAILSVCVAFSFLIYDDCSIFWMIYPCLGCLIAAIVTTAVCGIRYKDYHRKYIQYRALAEVLRTQFYICTCGTKAFICDEFSWTQKSDMVWIEKAMRTLFILHDFKKPLDKNKIKESWLIGQYNYHNSQLKDNKKKTTHKSQEKICKWATSVLFIVSIVLYSIILLFETLSLFGILDFWEGIFFHFKTISWRNVGAVAVGLSAVIALFFSSYFDKLSNGRKCDDHAKMKNLYIYALRNWDNIVSDKTRFNRFVINIAREEIIENGIWYSYVNERGLQVNI